jgi:hypothetical protein
LRKAGLIWLLAAALAGSGHPPLGASAATREGDAEVGARPLFVGTPAGWSFHDSANNASASTLLWKSGANGLLSVFCENGQPGFHLSLRPTDRRSLAGSEDGLLAVYTLEGPDTETPLGQFRVRFFSEGDLRSSPLHQSAWDHPSRFRDIILERGAGLRLVASRIRQGAFLEPRVVELHLPDGTDGSALPMDTALTFLDRACRTGLKSQGAEAAKPEPVPPAAR